MGHLSGMANPPPSSPQRHRRESSSLAYKPYDKEESRSRNASPTSGGSSSRSSSNRRSSFGSIKEDFTGEVAQSFVDTVDHDHGGHHSQDPKSHQFIPPQSPEFCCPCGGFLGWKQIPIGGRRQSRSYSDLRLLGGAHTRGWAWESVPSKIAPPVKEEKEPKKAKQGRAPIETLPTEILDQIISYLSLDIPPNGYTPRNEDLVSCLQTSRTIHSATLGVLYKNITIPHSIIFSKALNHIRQYPSLGTIVRRLDFSHFTSVGLGRTQQMNAEIQNLTCRTLLQCLELLPNLRECLLQEHVQDDIDVNVSRKLLTGLPRLQALDFCGCSSTNFTNGFHQAIGEPDFPPVLPKLQRLSLHECTSLSANAFETLLPRLVNLTHLDVAHTQITNDALFLILECAQITHLNISRCTRLTGPAVVKFLTTHPAVQNLVYLNVMADSSRHQLLSEVDVDNLLPHLASSLQSLRSLNLGGAKVTSHHMPYLVQLSKHLEELGLNSANITISDINSFFEPPQPKHPDEMEGMDGPGAAQHWVQPHLCYLDLTKNQYVTQAVLFNPKVCALVTPRSYPLDVIELGEKLIGSLRQFNQSKRGNGWVVRDLGRRGWYVREPQPGSSNKDDGWRTWKMGARWWGMRKIPVSVTEVGGIYGHYMFKK